MIVTEIYNGQGLGNQLWCYVVTRAIAKRGGYDFGIMHPERFKCLDFMNLDFGLPVIGGSGPEGGVPRTLPEGISHYYSERTIVDPKNGADIRMYDPTLAEIVDNTKVNGIMQDERYILDQKDEIREWLAIKPDFDSKEYASDSICVINFRGGEYVRIKEVFLAKKYWEDAVAHMRTIDPAMCFVVVTDDVPTAKKFFPSFAIHHKSIGSDYATIANAHYLILSNSSFAWFPAWLNEKAKLVIAPKYWAHHNVSDGYWSTGGAITSGWSYMDKSGALSSADECKKEFEEYEHAHRDWFEQPTIAENTLIVSNYYNDLSWVPQYTNDYLVYDQSADPILPPNIDQNKVSESEHRGHNIRDYCTYIIDHYDSLPDRTIFCAGNVFPRHVSQPYFNSVINATGFTPIFEAARHSPRRPIAHISTAGLYAEYNDSWYLRHHPTKYFHDYNDFLSFCFKNVTIPKYVEFAPGANYVVPKEHILKYPKSFYENLRLFVSHTDRAIPGESHLIERALYTIWHDEHELSDDMKSVLPADFTGVPKKVKLPSIGSLYRKTAGAAFSAQRKLAYASNKSRALMQYFTGKRNLSTLWQRPELVGSVRMYNRIMRILAAIHTRLALSFHALASREQVPISLAKKRQIAEYRKKICIYDAFIFFNELELLELRLSILDPYVDYFVIVEATETFSGKPKALVYEENKERFKKWAHKIIHHVTRDTPTSFYDAKVRLAETSDPLEANILHTALTSSNVPQGATHWLREFYQKECIKKALIGLNDTDICYISDIDEIWNPETSINYESSAVFKFKQLVYTYYLNNRSSEPWSGTFATQYKNIRTNSLNHLDSAHQTSYTYVKNGGWHFTNMGGAERIRTKLESYGHQEFNTPGIKTRIEEQMQSNKDFIGRQFKFWTDEKDLPEYLKEHKEQYKNLFK